MALFWMELAVAAVVIFIYWLYQLYEKHKRLPPGPWGIPVFGYIPFLKYDYHKQLVTLGQKYGGVFTVSFGSTPVVILNDWDAVNEALIKQSDTFSGRPLWFNFEEVLHRVDIITNDGPVWKTQRRFALHHFRNLGVGKTSVEPFVSSEVDRLSDHMLKLTEKSICGNGLFYTSLLNVVWGIVAGHTFELDDPAIENFKNILDFDFEAFASGNTLNFLPWLRYFFPRFFKHDQFLQNSQAVWDFLEADYDNHAKHFNGNDLKDFMDIFIAEQKKHDQNKQPFSIERNGRVIYSPFTKEHLIGASYNFFNAGVETSENTMAWSMLYLSLWPEIQDKVHEELDRIIGRGNTPTWADRNRLVYTGATLLEVQRMASIVPLSIVHCCTKPTQLAGYHLPEGTVVFPNLYGVHHDPKRWKDPEVFRPERFIDANGALTKPEYLIPFGVGSRLCLGEPLARMELYLFFTGIYHRFSFRLSPNHPKPTLDAVVGLTLRPKPFHVIISSRC